jgi:hypothetical protein
MSTQPSDPARAPTRHEPTAGSASGVGWRSPRRTAERLIDSPYGLLLVALGILLLIGILILTDFGSSVDEWHNTFYGALFLKAYETGSLLKSPGIDYFNGPFYFMVFNVTERLFHILNPGWLLTDGLHLTNYLTFLIGLFFFYRMAMRLMPRGVGLFVTGLLATQPVIFGHAFINQKDTPLMVFFLASVELGWTAADRLEKRLHSPDPGPTSAPSRRPSSPGWRAASGIAGLLVILLLADLWLAGTLQENARSLLAEVYLGRGPALLSELFTRVAQDAYKTPLSAYMEKLDAALFWGRAIITPLLAGCLLALWSVTLPASFSRFASWVRRWWIVLVAACVLGMTTSIRMFGPLAGLLVAIYWAVKLRRGSVPGLLLYAVVAITTTYLTWPVLWGNPVLAISQRMTDISEFSRNSVLFLGRGYSADNLPWQFLPVLFGIQLTLPAVGLFLIGIPAPLIRATSTRELRLLVPLIWLWILVPAVAVGLRLVPVYNGFRHVLFIVPPLFLIVGLGAMILVRILRPALVRGGLAALCLLPGIVGIVRLHPYEYIYYNELVGGVKGAVGRFDLDYWCTAYRAAMSEVNSLAARGDQVVTFGGITSAAPFVRPDLTLSQGADAPDEPDFALACRDDVYRQSFHPEMPVVDEVRIEGALLAVVKQRVPDR